MDGLGIMQQPKNDIKHLWFPRHFKDKGPALWECRKCGEVSYRDIPDATGCEEKKDGD